MTESEFWQILANMPAPKPIFWRLYYDSEGQPITYTMEDLPGTYIEIDGGTYAQAPANIRVINGQIVELKRTEQKLSHSDTGTPCHPNNVAIVVDQNEPHQKWSMQIYETN